jgi:hypothetical protein
LNIFDLLAPREGDLVTHQDRKYIRLSHHAWKNPAKQIITVDVLIDAEQVKTAEPQFRDLKAMIRVIDTEQKDEKKEST